MDALLAAIMTKAGGSALSDDVGGRVFLDEYHGSGPAVYPYAKFFIVSGVPEKTYSEDYENITVQFSLFSISESAVEIADMYADLTALFDECALTITGYTLIWMKRQNLTTMIDEITTPAGTATLKHWAVDYEILMSLN